MYKGRIFRLPRIAGSEVQRSMAVNIHSFHIKVVKFGGSSLADAEHVKKVGAIIRSDPTRLFVVPSAPGKR